MGRYEVSIPFAGYFTGEVEADNEKDAIQKAFDKCNFQVKTDDGCDFECGGVELLEAVSAGNVNYAPLAKASAEKID